MGAPPSGVYWKDDVDSDLDASEYHTDDADSQMDPQEEPWRGIGEQKIPPSKPRSFNTVSRISPFPVSLITT